MSWKPVVAGVDASPESVRAAVLAHEVASRAGTSFKLVHSVRDVWAEMAGGQLPMDVSEFNKILLETGRSDVVAALEGSLGPDALQDLVVRIGRPTHLLNEVANEVGADTIVLGGKHHSAAGRWLAGSTVHYMVRTSSLPILVAGPSERPITRVLAAVDLSSAAGPTLGAAERFAALFDARLQALHVVQPPPAFPEVPAGMSHEDLLHRSERDLERHVWPMIELADSERIVRRGPATDTIIRAAEQWNADLVVVGSHGKNWVDRVLLGSVTEALLNRLPTSLLIIPVTGPGARASKSESSGAKIGAAVGR